MPDGKDNSPDGQGTPDGGADKGKTYSEDYVKALIGERDKVKKALREREESERQAQESKLIEDGKLKEALALKDKELESLSGLKAELDQYRSRDLARKDTLLKQLPEAKRELYASLSSDQLADIVETLKTPDPTPGKKGGSTETQKPFEELTPEEKLDLKSKDYPQYVKLYREAYKKKNGAYPPFVI